MPHDSNGLDLWPMTQVVLIYGLLFPYLDLCKEGVLLRNVSPSLVLYDHFPGVGILEL